MIYENQRLSCDARLGIEGQNDTLNLMLYRLLRVTSITDASGAKVNFTQKVVSFQGLEALQVNHIQIPIGESTQANTTLKINYEGMILGYTVTGMSYAKDKISPDFTILRMDAFAYPVKGMPSAAGMGELTLQSFDYSISATVPDSLKAVTLGKLVGAEQNEGTIKYKYESIVPSWRIDMAIAKYSTLSFDNLKVHYFEEDSAGAQRVYTALQQTKVLYDSWLGKKDLKNFTAIEIPDGYGSQADLVGVIQTASAFKEPEYIYEFYHELSHLWNIPHTDKSPCRLESEGLAMFLQYLVTGRFENNDYLEKMAQATLESVNKRLLKSTTFESTPIIEYGEKGLTGYSYTKGMLFFYTLYHMVGEQEFFNAIKGYYAEYKDTGSTTKEFAEYLKKTINTHSVDKLINDWIYTNQSSATLLSCKTAEELWK